VPRYCGNWSQPELPNIKRKFGNGLFDACFEILDRFGQPPIPLESVQQG
jgi:hypothetical protein